MSTTTFQGPVRSQNGFQSITTNASTGAVTVTAAFDSGVVLGTQILTAPGAVDVTNAFTQFATSGSAQALTLADGTLGEVKIISHIADLGSAVLTPTTKVGFSTITFTNAGDTAMLIYTTAGWGIVALNGAVAA